MFSIVSGYNFNFSQKENNVPKEYADFMMSPTKKELEVNGNDNSESQNSTRVISTLQERELPKRQRLQRLKPKTPKVFNVSDYNKLNRIIRFSERQALVAIHQQQSELKERDLNSSHQSFKGLHKRTMERLAEAAESDKLTATVRECLGIISPTNLEEVNRRADIVAECDLAFDPYCNCSFGNGLMHHHNKTGTTLHFDRATLVEVTKALTEHHFKHPDALSKTFVYKSNNFDFYSQFLDSRLHILYPIKPLSSGTSAVAYLAFDVVEATSKVIKVPNLVNPFDKTMDQKQVYERNKTSLIEETRVLRKIHEKAGENALWPDFMEPSEMTLDPQESPFFGTVYPFYDRGDLAAYAKNSPLDLKLLLCLKAWNCYRSALKRGVHPPDNKLENFLVKLEDGDPDPKVVLNDLYGAIFDEDPETFKSPPMVSKQYLCPVLKKQIEEAQAKKNAEALRDLRKQQTRFTFAVVLYRIITNVFPELFLKTKLTSWIHPNLLKFNLLLIFIVLKLL